MPWDADPIKYGYVVDRLEDGRWWHLHFGRSKWGYHCELLGRRTDIFACLRRFARGVAADSPDYLLNLDGEGVEPPEAIGQLNFEWSSGAGEADTQPRVFQRKIVPRLYSSTDFQKAMAHVVAHGRFLRLMALEKLSNSP